MKLKLLFLFVLFTNLWIWKIASTNIFLAVLLILTSYIFYKTLTNKKYYFILIVAYALVFFFQYKTTSIQSLSSLTKNEELSQIQRVKEYPPTYIQIGSKTLWIPAAHWFEERKEFIILRHMEENLFEVLDPNLYFFANHPRERVGYTEFEMFPYILLPFFLYGMYQLFLKNQKFLVFTFLIPLLFLTFIGNNNPLGPFLFFPLMVCLITIGLQKAYQQVEILKHRNYFVGVFLIVYVLVLVQVISYAIH